MSPGASGILFTPGDAALGPNDGSYNPATALGQPNIGLPNEYNINPADIPAGTVFPSGLSYYDTLLSPANQSNAAVPHVASRGIATLPGGIPIFEDGVLVGGIGVFFPGTTGFASAENSSLSAGYNPNMPDLSLEAEYIALAAVGGSAQAGFPVGAIGKVPALQGFSLPNPFIDLGGITLNAVGPGGQSGPQNLINYVTAHFSLNTGNPNSSIVTPGAPSTPLNLTGNNDEPVNFGGATLLQGISPTTGYLVTPHAGGGLTAAQVQTIITQGIEQADVTRSQIRPLGTPDAADVVCRRRQRRRRAGPVPHVGRPGRRHQRNDLQGPQRGLLRRCHAGGLRRSGSRHPGRRRLHRPHLRIPGVALLSVGHQFGPAGPLVDPQRSGYQSGHRAGSGCGAADLGLPQLRSATTPSIRTRTSCSSGPNTSGVIFFPGNSAVYVNGKIVGGFGASGDGIGQDDVVTAGGISGFGPPADLDVDNYFYLGVRLPYQKFSRNPDG